MAAAVLSNAKSDKNPSSHTSSSAWQAVENIHRTLIELEAKTEPTEGCWHLGLQRTQPLKDIMLLRAVDLGSKVTGVFDDGR